MSDRIHTATLASSAANTNPSGKRAHAVAIALEIIAARAEGIEHPANLEDEFNKLSTYADLIQAALVVK